MANLKPRTVHYRRRREQKTDYHKKLKLLSSRKPRLVVRITGQKIISQLVGFGPKGDLVLTAADSSQLLKFGWNYSLKNLPAAYLTGLLAGKSALEKGLPEAVLDTGAKIIIPHNKISAFLKGAVDSGLNVPFGEEEIFPDEERISGKHVQDYAEKLIKEDRKKYEQKFSRYLKAGQAPEKMAASFEKAKEKIMGAKASLADSGKKHSKSKSS